MSSVVERLGDLLIHGQIGADAWVRVPNALKDDTIAEIERLEAENGRRVAIGDEAVFANLQYERKRATHYRAALERFEPWMAKPCREIAERYQREAHFGPPCGQGTKLAFYEQWKKIAAAIQAATEALEVEG